MPETADFGEKQRRGLTAPWRSITAWFAGRRSRVDLFLVIAATVVSAMAANVLEPAERFHAWSVTETFEEYLDLDELPFILLFLAAALGWYGWRRSLDQATEARFRIAELVRLRRAEEALRLANETLEARVEERVRDLGQETGQRLNAEIAVGRLQSQIEHLNRLAVIDLMAVALAHELSHPLFALNNYLSGIIARLESGAFTVAQLLGGCKVAFEQCGRASEIVRRFRDFTRRAAPNRQPLDLDAAMRQARLLIAPLATRQGITAAMDIADGLPPVVADRAQFEQVLVNLSLNAIEAMAGAGGTRRHLKLSASRGAGGNVEIQVADTGPGIDAEHLARVFDPYFTTKAEGTGMGLAICRAIVEAHDGRIEVEPDAGTGTVFTIIWPTAND